MGFLAIPVSVKPVVAIRLRFLQGTLQLFDPLLGGYQLPEEGVSNLLPSKSDFRAATLLAYHLALRTT
jgi:hypothetical protein